MTTPRVMIAIPCYDRFSAKMGMSLAGLTHFLGRTNRVNLWACRMARGCIVPHARQHLAEQALRENTTHILWIDADMTFPGTILHRLLDAEKPFVGVNGVTRGQNPMPTAQRGDERVWTYPDSEGLEEVDVIGFGAVLTETWLFHPHDHDPWFGLEYEPNGGIYSGSDVHFCHKVWENHQVKPWIDHDLSKQIGHTGEHLATLQEAWHVAGISASAAD